MIEAGNHAGKRKKIHALRGRRGLEGNDRKAYLARGKGEKKWNDDMQEERWIDG